MKNRNVGQPILAAAAFQAALTLLTGTALAQDKVTVPLSSPNQPAIVTGTLMSGSVTVMPGMAGQVVVESRLRSGQGDRVRNRERDTPPPGMHRLDVGADGLNVEEDHNTVTIGGLRTLRNEDLVIEVPVNTSVKLRTLSGGSIDIAGINGDQDVQNMNGSIRLTNVSGSVVAHTLNGSITAILDRVAQGKPMSFTSLNGKIDVTLPADTKARLRLKTDNGEAYTDFDVKMEPDNSRPVIEDARSSGGKYRIRMERGVYGTINGGGPEYTFQTLNGSIYIHRK
jgi:hypothetical protein